MDLQFTVLLAFIVNPLSEVRESNMEVQWITFNGCSGDLLPPIQGGCKYWKKPSLPERSQQSFFQFLHEGEERIGKEKELLVQRRPVEYFTSFLHMLGTHIGRSSVIKREMKCRIDERACCIQMRATPCQGGFKIQPRILLQPMLDSFCNANVNVHSQRQNHQISIADCCHIFLELTQSNQQITLVSENSVYSLAKTVQCPKLAFFAFNPVYLLQKCLTEQGCFCRMFGASLEHGV